MPKNILIFADGTGQVGGVRPDQQLSNIYKLFRATRIGPDSPIDPKVQVAYYDPGLGTASASGNVRVGILDGLKSLGGLAIGLGFSGNVIDCYEAILKRYEPGDRIYLFGFSRGGYTVRSVANVLNLCGVPTTDGAGGSLPRTGIRLRAIATEAVKSVYEHGAGHPRAKFEAQREAIARRFRAKYGAGVDPNHGDVYPEFIGVFDAVAALGLPLGVRIATIVGYVITLSAISVALGWVSNIWLGWSGVGVAASLFLAGLISMGLAYARATLRWASKEVKGTEPHWHLAMWNSKHYDRFLDDRIPNVRHALAIDETRVQFGRVKWGGSRNSAQIIERRFQQRWFPGNHSDIGGSYPEEESRLSDISLQWMVEQATSVPNPIIVDRDKLHLYPDPLGPQHSEVFAQRQGTWWKRRPAWPSAPRYINDEGELDPSVLARFAASCVVDCDVSSPYRPESLHAHKLLATYYPQTEASSEPPLVGV